MQQYTKCFYELINTSNLLRLQRLANHPQQSKVFQRYFFPGGTQTAMLCNMQEAKTARGRYSKLPAAPIMLKISRSMCQRELLRRKHEQSSHAPNDRLRRRLETDFHFISFPFRLDSTYLQPFFLMDPSVSRFNWSWQDGNDGQWYNGQFMRSLEISESKNSQ